MILEKAKVSFTICSFWLVEALFYIGEKEKAKEIYDKLLKNSNHLGLFSEDIDISNKRAAWKLSSGIYSYSFNQLFNSF